MLLAGCGNSGSAPETSGQDSSIRQSETVPPASGEAVSGEANASGEPNAGTEPAADGEASIVYFTSDISPEGMVAIYEALGWEPTGKVAVKLSTGEPPASNYLRPELIKDLVELVDGTIVECNTAYGGSRAETAMHYQVAEDHGFTAIADFQILDEDGSMSLPVEGGSQLTENLVGAAFGDYDSYLVLSHFKGHAMAG
ncbi:MAG: DUF362 domain-containing protein, partial [Lachnospiraceae bacterium]|nr:DUF362 domain-containing protein [Lachnospiraceae bacterium]